MWVSKVQEDKIFKRMNKVIEACKKMIIISSSTQSFYRGVENT